MDLMLAPISRRNLMLTRILEREPGCHEGFRNRLRFVLTPLLVLTLFPVPTPARAQTAAVQARLDADIAAGNPVIVHVIVPLCDNRYQGIVPVQPSLGNGQSPRNNLYWGARYGLRTFMLGDGGWDSVVFIDEPTESILEKIVLRSVVTRADTDHNVYLIAEAWDGRRIRGAVDRFLRIAAGYDAEVIPLAWDGDSISINAGGTSHLVAYVGHNGLMDFSLADTLRPAPNSAAKSSVVLACASRSYFLDPLRVGGSQPLLLTTGLMAPEAYTLDAIIRAWAAGGSPEEVRQAAAVAYAKYQRCSVVAARRLFSVEL